MGLQPLQLQHRLRMQVQETTKLLLMQQQVHTQDLLLNLVDHPLHLTQVQETTKLPPTLLLALILDLLLNLVDHPLQVIRAPETTKVLPAHTQDLLHSQLDH